MFYLRYILSELLRRKGRTALTVVGLAVGVGMVVSVMALSKGLDKAQSEILKPLTGIGTEMSVSRPVQASGSGDDQSFDTGQSGQRLSSSEQEKLRKENGNPRLNLNSLGKAGESFSTDNFMASQLSFPASTQTKVAGLNGVKAVSAGLTLNLSHISGKIPKNSGNNSSQGGPPGAGAGGGSPPSSLDFQQSTISGIDTTNPNLGLLKQSNVTGGSYFTEANAKEAILSQTYAKRKGLEVGKKIKLKNHNYLVVGIAKAAVGGQQSDIYVPLKRLQKLSDREGRVNNLTVEATDTDTVDSVSESIESTIAGSEVSTASDVADRVSGSLVDAQSLSNKLGTVLAAVALFAAFAIASLLTLTSINKRTRELGTLKAVGWSQWQVVRQVTGEALTQGLMGGMLGAGLGLAAAAAIGNFGPKLTASVAPITQSVAGFNGPPGAANQAQEVVETVSKVQLTAPVDVTLILLAVGLALVGGLIAGLTGASRAARLRPAEALRSVE